MVFSQEVESTPADSEEWVVPRAMEESDSDAAEASVVVLTDEGATAEMVPPTPSDILAGVKQHVLGEKTALPALTEFRGYKTGTNGSMWMVGNGDQFGAYTLWDDYYQPAGIESGFDLGIALSFLAGPDQTDMPPRLYNFQAGYQKRNKVEYFAYDVAVGVNAASDFEGSSRDGIRFPAHAVGYMTVVDELDIVFGADFLDWAAIHWLPVAGVIWTPTPDLRFELVFPSPRVDLQLTETHRIYLAGGLGGGTWAVERDNEVDDLVTYYDLRAAVGLEQASTTRGWSAWEVAVLFDRELEFTSQDGNYSPNATVLVRGMTRF
jgi:hypothetical protein